MRVKNTIWAAVCFLLILALPASAEGRKGYYRFPAIHGDMVVFVSEGDLWSVDVRGGHARRLTSHAGLESTPAFSPDGKTLAFSAQYEGPTEVYIMPVEGGLPKRLTFAGQASMVVGWTPSGRIIYATQKYSTLPNTQLVLLDPRTGREELVPLAQAADGVFDGQEKNLFFTRLPFQGSYTKRYKGGTVQNIWKFESGTDEAVPLTSGYPGTSKNPIFWNGRLYFLTDRDGIMNLWSMQPDGSDLKQLTFHKDFDASSPSMAGGRIVYQLLADIRMYDIASARDSGLEITIPSDFDQTREKWLTKPVEYLTSVHLSPGGDRLALIARGQVFVAPAGDGRLVRISVKEGIRNRAARFLPDGRHLMVLSDETGEWEFYRFPADGLGRPERLTSGADVIRFDGLPSPDGRWLAFSDKNNRLWLADLKSKAQKEIASSPFGMPSDHAWSADSRWLAFVTEAANQFRLIMIYDTVTGNLKELTSDRVDSYGPAWSADGKWLYFLSDRYFRSVVGSPWGARQPEPYFDKTTKIYAVGLTGKDIFPFTPADELTEKENKPPKNAGNTGTQKADPVVIDFNGLQDRIREVPLPAGVYSGLIAGEKALFFIDRESRAAGRPKLKAVEIKNRDIKAKTVIEDIAGFEVSSDGKKMLVRKGQDFYVLDVSLSAPPALAEKKVDLSKWTFSIDPKQEWQQMFVDAWRMERDYFYDRNLHNVDYEGLLERHLPFLDRISDRSELNDLIAHLVGELSALHTFVRGGDLRRPPDNVVPGSLGARLAADEKLGGWKVEHIYRADPDYLERRSPLAGPDLKIREGDIITAINGRPVTPAASPYLPLRNTAGSQVLIEVKPAAGGLPFKEIIYPISQSEDADLRYADWEYSRRLEVEKAGGGEIGYIHLRAMSGSNYTEWVRDFYPVFNRKGLIIDVRHNRGGNIDSWILEKLLRRPWFFWQPRVGEPYWSMQYAFRGHIVVLCDEYTASDGEAFSEGFRRLGLGKIIGTRTWGGEIWLSSSNVLVDRGLASAAETGVYGPEREWLIEGHGVEPDIVVDNPPHATFKGRDAQLEAAVKHLQDLIKKEPVEIPKHPPYPDKKK